MSTDRVRVIVAVNSGAASVAFADPRADVMVLDFDSLAEELASADDVAAAAQRLGIPATADGFADYYLDGFEAEGESAQTELDNVRDWIREIVLDAQR